LTEIRSASKISQCELSKELSISQELVKDWESVSGKIKYTNFGQME